MKKGLLPCEKNCLFFAAPLDGTACSMVKYYGNSMSKKEHEKANGKAPEITELLGIKQSTLKYTTGNMYTKLGVSSRKQLLNLAALYADRQKRQQDAQP